LNVFRPADSVECAECWEIALGTEATPSILALTRQGLPLLRTAHTDENLSKKGAYVLIEPEGLRDVTLIGTGSEVSLAITAAKALQGQGIAAAVVSMPCWELFAGQDQGYQDTVLGTVPRIGVEAAVDFGWQKWLGLQGIFIGMRGFGASAPGEELYKYFGITAVAGEGAGPHLAGTSKKGGDMSNKRVAINGCGRIGRLTLRAFLEARRKDLDFVAINDLGSAEMNAHLLEFDTVHGRFPGKISAANGHLKADGHDIA